MCDKKKCSIIGLLAKAALCVVAVFAVAVASLPLWIGPVVTGLAGKIVPNYTGTGFSIDRFRLNPYAGTVEIGGVKLSNPAGFGETAAFALAGFNAEISVGSLFSDTILVKKVDISEPFVSYYSHDGRNNFDVILANVDKAMGPKNDKASAAPEKNASNAQKKKVIIDRMSVSGVRVKLMKSDLMPPLALPPIKLTDIGRKSGGATLEEAWQQIFNAVMSSMSSAGDGLGALGGLFGEGLKGLSETPGAAKGAADGMKNLFKGLGK